MDGTGGENGGVDAGAGVVVTGEVGEEGAVEGGGFWVEGDHAAAWDALADADAGDGANLEGLAGEGVFGEGEVGGEVQDDVGAEPAGVSLGGMG